MPPRQMDNRHHIWSGEHISTDQKANIEIVNSMKLFERKSSSIREKV